MSQHDSPVQGHLSIVVEWNRGIYNGAAMAAAASWAVRYEEDGEEVFVREERRLREVGFVANRFTKRMRLVGLVRDSEGVVNYVAGTVG